MKRIANLISCLLLILALAGCNTHKQAPLTTTPSPVPNIATESPVIQTIPDNSTFAVHYIDVGQADSALLLCDGHSMLIDGGNAEDSNLIVAYLRKQNIDALDYIVCTHAHEDHVGGLSAPLSAMAVGNVYAPETEADTKAYVNFKTKAQNQGLDIIHPATGDTVNLGSATAEFIVPSYKVADDLNNTSIMCKVTYGNTSFLFTGDAEREEEQDILSHGCNLNANVLKVGHHGSDSSTSYVFLREVMPKYAVISVGKDNSYGHPSGTTLSRLRDAEAQVFRTDLQGDIIATSDGNTVNITTQKNENIQTNTTKKEPINAETQYIGNKNSKKFHRPSCHTLPAEKNRVYFSSRDEAISASYSPCQNCNP